MGRKYSSRRNAWQSWALTFLAFALLAIFGRLRHGSVPVVEREGAPVARSSSVGLKRKIDAFGAECLTGTRRGPGVRSMDLVVAVIVTSNETEWVNVASSTWAQETAGVKVLFFCTSCPPSPRRNVVVVGESVPVIQGVLDYVHANYRPRLLLRVGARSYVHVERVWREALALCSSVDCSGDLLWAGCLHTHVNASAAYTAATGLSEFLPYMAPDAYLLSGLLVSALAFVQSNVGLRPLSAVDETKMLALWLVAVPVERKNLDNLYRTGAEMLWEADDQPALDLCQDTAPAVVLDLHRPRQVELLHLHFLRCLSSNVSPS